MAKKYLEQLTVLLNQLKVGQRSHAQIACKHVFSGAAAWADGKMFCSLTPVAFALKLPPAERRRLLKKSGVHELRYFPSGPIKKDYVVLPDGLCERERPFRRLIGLSIEHARAKNDSRTTTHRVDAVLTRLGELADKRKVTLKEKKFGIVATNALGIYQKDLQSLAKEIGCDEELAGELFDSGIYEARILCSKTFPPEKLTSALIKRWGKTSENWEICDSFCMGLFAQSRFAVPKAQTWSSRKREFEK